MAHTQVVAATGEINNPEQEDFEQLDIFKCFKRSPYSSTKHSSYFHVYEELLERFRNRTITFVEIGVLNGGSLFMWRDYFGPQARIVAVDLNPAAKRWEADGFEIHIGDQSDPAFWQDFYAKVGPIDVLLDDGGHTYEQQIVTVCETLPHLREDGLVIVEDTHTSYFKEFGYPSPYSFVEWTKRLIDNINSRFPGINQPFSALPYKQAIYSLHIYESIVAFHVRRALCRTSHLVTNGAPVANHIDFRNKGNIVWAVEEKSNAIARRYAFLRRIPVLGDLLSWGKLRLIDLTGRVYSKARLRRLRDRF